MDHLTLRTLRINVSDAAAMLAAGKITDEEACGFLALAMKDADSEDRKMLLAESRVVVVDMSGKSMADGSPVSVRMAFGMSKSDMDIVREIGACCEERFYMRVPEVSFGAFTRKETTFEARGIDFRIRNMGAGEVVAEDLARRCGDVISEAVAGYGNSGWSDSGSENVAAEFENLFPEDMPREFLRLSCERCFVWSVSRFSPGCIPDSDPFFLSQNADIRDAVKDEIEDLYGEDYPNETGDILEALDAMKSIPGGWTREMPDGTIMEAAKFSCADILDMNSAWPDMTKTQEDRESPTP